MAAARAKRLNRLIEDLEVTVRAPRVRFTHVDGRINSEITSSYEAAGELLRALSAPARIGIVVALDDGPKCVHELVDALQAPQPLISQHLRVLRSAGVVKGSRSGREISYSLTDEHIAHIVTDAVDHVREED